MIDLSTPNEWQHRDESLGGILFPWYVKSFLDELVTWDLKDKAVLEIGLGASSLWWHRKCKQLYGCDNNPEYVFALNDIIIKGALLRVLYEREHFVQFIKDYGYVDIIIIDGEPIEWRDACVQPALDCLKPGGKLIIDNWLQPSVGWMSSYETQKLLSQYPIKVYHQEGHPDWKTAVFTKP
jgi:predicted O-methyltransferase YrrM